MLTQKEKWISGFDSVMTDEQFLNEIQAIMSEAPELFEALRLDRFR